MQFEHGYPMDFTRWTTCGLQVLMNDFEKISIGISELAEEYTKKFIHYANVDAGLPVDKNELLAASDFIRKRELIW